MGLLQRVAAFIRSPFTRAAPIYANFGSNGWNAGYSSNLGTIERLTDNQRLQRNSGLIARAIFQIAEDTAELAVTVNRRKRNGKLELDAGHELTALIERPNAFASGHDFRNLLVQHLKVFGRACVLVEETTAGISALHVLQADRCEPIADPTDFIAYYRYRTLNGMQINFAPFNPRAAHPDGQSVLEIRLPSPDGPYQGSSSVEHAAMDGQLGNEVRAYMRWFFANNATPGTVFETTEPYPGAEIAAARKNEYANAYRGSLNAGKTFIAWGGGKIQTMAPEFAKIDFPGLARATREEILGLIGIPGSVLGMTSSGSLAGNAAQAERSSYEAGTLTSMQRRVRAFWRLIAVRYPQAIIEIESPIQADKQFEATQRQWQFEHGVIDRLEYRAMANLEDDGKGNGFLLPTSSVFSAVLLPTVVEPPAVIPDAARALRAQYRGMFTLERQLVDAAGGLSGDLERALHDKWLEIAPSVADKAREMRAFAVTRAGIVQGFETLKSDGARILAGSA